MHSPAVRSLSGLGRGNGAKARIRCVSADRYQYQSKRQSWYRGTVGALTLQMPASADLMQRYAGPGPPTYEQRRSIIDWNSGVGSLEPMTRRHDCLSRLVRSLLKNGIVAGIQSGMAGPKVVIGGIANDSIIEVINPLELFDGRCTYHKRSHRCA